MNLKKHLPHIYTIAGFVVITLIYFSPLLGGKKLKQSDTSNWIGMSKEIIDYREKTGDEALWTNSMFGGMPAYQISVEYNNNLIQYLHKILTLGIPVPADYLFMYLLGFYFLLITIGVNQRVAIFGAIAFAFSTYFFVAIETGHNTKALALAYMPPVVAGVIRTYRGQWLLGGVITSVALSLELYANHLQITYYLLLILVLYAVSELVQAVRSKSIVSYFKSSAILVAAAMLAIAPNISNLWATEEYGKASTRGPSELSIHKDIQTTGLDKDYITDWSYGIGESWTFLVPNFKGGSSQPIAQENKDELKKVDSNFRQYVGGFNQYFGDMPFTMGPVYVGAIVCLLFLLGMFVVKGPLKWWLLAASVLSFFLSWGKNFMSFSNIFLDHVPGYDKFRAVSMTLVIAEFTFPFLAALALDAIIRNGELLKAKKKVMMIAMGSLIGFTLLMMASPDMFTSFHTEREYDAILAQTQGQNIGQDVLDNLFSNVDIVRKAIFVNDAMRTFFLLLLAGGLLWSYIKYKYKPDYLVYGLLMLTFIDLWSVNKRYLNSDDFTSKTAAANPFPMTAADQYIEQDNSNYRVLNLAANTFNDASTSFYHQSIGGYHGAKLKRYKELIDSTLTQEMQNIRISFGLGDTAARVAVASQAALNMLNTKYIIYNGEAAPLQNPNALGNAWIVKEARLVPNADAELAATRQFDPSSTAIVDQRFKDQVQSFSYQPDSSASIKLASYQPNHLTYEYHSTASQLTVFSEIYYDKGWKAFVDGKEAPYFRCNYVLRGMVVPAGKHSIEFKFEPEVIATGGKISLAGSVLLIGLLGFLIYKEVRKTRPTPLTPKA